ncbi:Pentatricopeptide repeat-containing family protein [Rhynchospora pubera]|uniref:Pentatricopeptide repeat-containing family protein n=1 Tax=Rhynchospora pubera TaxID=906938 RepID=A0AAV8BRG5_9POAL|nr:Pentatricopeptide repeat-containing family protein [Rhynchospora pubera]
MNAAVFSIARRLRRTLQTTLQSQFSTSARRYNPRKPERRLQSIIFPVAPPSTNLVPEIERWIEKGNTVHPYDLQLVIKGLRRLRRFRQALEVSEWMKTKSNLPFRPGDHAVQLDLIGVVHGMSSAEDCFNKLPQEHKTEKAYGALLNCYVRERQVDKALAHMDKMRQLGLAYTPLPYNNIMSLYAAAGEHEKVYSVLSQMKEDGVFPDNFSYRICIGSCGARSDVSGMKKLLQEMEQQPQIVMDWNTYTVVANVYLNSGFPALAVLALEKAEEKMNKSDSVAYNHLISLYARLRDKRQVQRLWELQKNNCKRPINRDYLIMLNALVKLDDIKEAEVLLKQWYSSLNILDFRVPNILFRAYQTSGQVEKAEALLDQFVKEGKKPHSNSWGIVAAGYVVLGEMDKAHAMMKNALYVYMPNMGWSPDHKLVNKILYYLGENGDLEDVETFIDLLEVARPRDSDMYYALIKARIRAGKEVDDLLKGMKDDGVKESEDIKEVLASAEKREEIGRS